ncbi:IS200/IS605 family accessory protein TnpB-related protein [Paenibacillus beijingensis]|uniref:IS200/IS605 family accessory protein TnpB-related protein n=1 Tax=Paenibacillus beijingensis TaxID=1126833 RepID=UPI000695E7A0|nr:IS200/IS605 family accessory protein TnpB-related protein [Paenibacillus beijingensis]
MKAEFVRDVRAVYRAFIIFGALSPSLRNRPVELLGNTETLEYIDRYESGKSGIQQAQSSSKYQHVLSTSIFRFFSIVKLSLQYQTLSNRYVHNFLHQASRQIVDLAVEHQCRTIVIGKMKGIKHEHPCKMFVQIPHARFVDLITYKAKLAGIKVTRQNEAYTSGCSALDEENISQKSYAPGRRIHRGLFVSNMGLAINADVNGSLNILRKYMKQKGSPDLIRSARDNGCLKHPKRILVG